MKIDQANLPTEVWHITRERIREGKGVQHLKPLPDKWWHSALGHSTFHIKGRKGAYHSIDCYATQEEAWFKATGILRRELRDETTRHCGVMERLKEAENALKGVKE